MGGFSKTSYRNRRKAGKRGQGDKFNPIKHLEDGVGGHMVRGPKGFQMVNRKQARTKLRLRHYDDEDDKTGRPFTRKGVKHRKGEPKYTGPTYDPTVTNHERVFRQRIKSGRIKVNQGDQSDGK